MAEMEATMVLTVRCQVSGRDVPLDAALPADLVRDSLIPTLREMCPTWSSEGYVSLEELNKARLKHVEGFVRSDNDDEARARQEVLHSIEEKQILSRDIYEDLERQQSLGDRAADKIAEFGGSWKFIGLFAALLVGWMTINSLILAKGAFDPYPYILLNLVLSCLAAIQAPVIMMSQNRQEERDRLRAENDYKVNLKAELEIRHLNEKVDRMLNDQWKHLLEIQQMQMDMIEEMNRKNEVLKAKTSSDPEAETRPD